MHRKTDRCIALLGGAFDPVHGGHIALARRALRDFPIAAVRMIPNGAPPHRAKTKLSWARRAELCAQAVANIPRINVGWEESPARIRFTIDTVRRYKNRGWRVVLIVGADAFAKFHLWRAWAHILRMANLAVARRRGGGNPHPAVRAQMREVHCPQKLAFGAGRVLLWRFCPGDISSTAIRARRAQK